MSPVYRRRNCSNEERDVGIASQTAAEEAGRRAVAGPQFSHPRVGQPVK